MVFCFLQKIMGVELSLVCGVGLGLTAALAFCSSLSAEPVLELSNLGCGIAEAGTAVEPWAGVGAAAGTAAGVVQTTPDSLQTKELQEVQIDGTSKKTSTINSVGIQKIGKEDIIRSTALVVGEIAKQFNGVQIKDYGGIGGMKTISVRSLGANHTAVAYNGVVMSNAQNGQCDLSRLSVDKLGSISLSNALPASIFEAAKHFSSASILDIKSNFSLSDTQKRVVEASLTAGSFMLWSPFINYEQKIGKNTKWSLDAKYTDVKGNYPYTIVNNKIIEKRRRENSDVHSGLVQTRLQTYLNDKQSLDFDFHYDESERGLPGATILYAPSSLQRWRERVIYSNLKHKIDYNNVWSQKSIIKYDHSYTYFHDPLTLSSKGEQKDIYILNSVYTSSVVLFSPEKVKNLVFSSAVDFDYSFLAANTEFFANPKRESLWLNLAGEYKNKYFEIVANVLGNSFFDQTHIRESGVRSKENRFHISPCVSMAVKPLGAEDFSLRIFYKDIFRMPTFNDLYYDMVGNSKLKPEIAKSIDFGLSYRTMFKDIYLDFSADAYRNWVRDKIVALPTKNIFRWSMYNLGKVNIGGLDLSLGLEYKIKDVVLNLRTAYTYESCIDVTDSESALYKNQIPYTPKHFGSANASVGYKFVNLSYGLVWSGSRYSRGENISRNYMPPYSDQSLSLAFEGKVFKGIWRVSLDYLNIENKTYEIVRGYAMPGSQFRISIKCRY